jgi:flagellar hook assembly protein FlgD
MRGALGRSGEGVLEIFGVGGQLVQTIVVGAEAGRFSVWWNGRDRHGSVLPTGVYYARLRSDDEGPSGARKIVFLR